MKKTIFSLICILFVISYGFANSATQKLYDYDSIEYQETKFLTAAAGVLGPSSATPVNGHELLIALKRIDVNKLNAFARQRYEELYNSISYGNNSFYMDLEGSVSPQIFLTLDQDGSEGIISNRYDFFLPYAQEEAFLSLKGQFSLGDNVFLEAEFPLKNGASATGVPILSSDFLLSYKNGEWLIWNNVFTELPYLARGAVGNEWLNIVIGRTRHQLGSAYTGNLLISDNFPFQELLKISATSNILTYNISLTNFGTQTSVNEFERSHIGGAHQVRLVHRFDFAIANRVRLAINFANTFFSSSAFDFRFFIPFMIFHNYYNSSNSREIQNPYDEANNIFALEMEAAIIPGLTLGAQFVLDQIQLEFEDGDLPNAFGGLINITWTETLENSSYSVWGEAVYTSSFLYLNEKCSNGDLNYNYDWILGYYTDKAPILAYSGYPLGPDTIAFAIGANYRNYPHDITVDGRLMYSMTGENGGVNGILDPTFGDNYENENTPSGIVWHAIKLEGNIDWGILDNLHFLGGLSLQYHINYKNESSRNIIIPQLYSGIKWSFL